MSMETENGENMIGPHGFRYPLPVDCVASDWTLYAWLPLTIRFVCACHANSAEISSDAKHFQERLNSTVLQKSIAVDVSGELIAHKSCCCRSYTAHILGGDRRYLFRALEGAANGDCWCKSLSFGCKLPKKYTVTKQRSLFGSIETTGSVAFHTRLEHPSRHPSTLRVWVCTVWLCFRSSRAS